MIVGVWSTQILKAFWRRSRNVVMETSELPLIFCSLLVHKVCICKAGGYVFMNEFDWLRIM